MQVQGSPTQTQTPQQLPSMRRVRLSDCRSHFLFVLVVVSMPIGRWTLKLSRDYGGDTQQGCARCYDKRVSSSILHVPVTVHLSCAVQVPHIGRRHLRFPWWLEHLLNRSR